MDVRREKGGKGGRDSQNMKDDFCDRKKESSKKTTAKSNCPPETNSSQRVTKYYGLERQAATCSFNTVLQILFMNKDFREAVGRVYSITSNNTDAQLNKLFDNLKKDKADSSAVKLNLGGRAYIERDPVKYLERILNTTSPEASQMFRGQLRHRTTYCRCQHHIDVVNPFWNLPLVMDTDTEVYSVLNGFFKHSKFSGHKQIDCHQCRSKRDATTQTEIMDHPEILTLLLNRYEYDKVLCRYNQSYRCADVPLNLQMAENQTYELHAVLDHHGGIPGCGYWTATIKSQDDGRWYKFGNTCVTLMNPQPFQTLTERSNTAYLLMYKKEKKHIPDQDSGQRVHDKAGEDCQMLQHAVQKSVARHEDSKVVRADTFQDKHRSINMDVNRDKHSKGGGDVHIELWAKREGGQEEESYGGGQAGMAEQGGQKEHKELGDGEKERPHDSQKQGGLKGQERQYDSQKHGGVTGQERQYDSQKYAGVKGQERQYDSQKQGGLKGQERQYDSQKHGGVKGHERPYDSQKQGGLKGQERQYDSQKHGGVKVQERPYDSQYHGGVKGKERPYDSQKHGGEKGDGGEERQYDSQKHGGVTGQERQYDSQKQGGLKGQERQYDSQKHGGVKGQERQYDSQKHGGVKGQERPYDSQYHGGVKGQERPYDSQKHGGEKGDGGQERQYDSQKHGGVKGQERPYDSQYHGGVKGQERPYDSQKHGGEKGDGGQERLYDSQKYAGVKGQERQYDSQKQGGLKGQERQCDSQKHGGVKGQERPHDSQKQGGLKGQERQYDSQKHGGVKGQERPYDSQYHGGVKGQERPYDSQKHGGEKGDGGEERQYDSQKHGGVTGQERQYDSQKQGGLKGQERQYDSQKHGGVKGQERQYDSQKHGGVKGQERPYDSQYHGGVKGQERPYDSQKHGGEKGDGGQERQYDSQKHGGVKGQERPYDSQYHGGVKGQERPYDSQKHGGEKGDGGQERLYDSQKPGTVKGAVQKAAYDDTMYNSVNDRRKDSRMSKIESTLSACRYNGLLNQGSTCYLNSVLQVLFMTKDFRKAVERHCCENPKNIDAQLNALFEDLKTHPSYTYKITQKMEIKEVYVQRDAAEYLEKILIMTSPGASQIFLGELRYKTTCCRPSCRHYTDVVNPFWNLPLAIDTDSKVYSVMDGISKFFRPKHLNGDNQMYCDNCDAKEDATFESVINHYPEILTLLLKRFEFNFHLMDYIKVDRSVDVPTMLNIPETYELYGVVDHSGSLKGGHYTARIKSQDDDRWYCFNDSSVTELHPQPFQSSSEKSSSAYVLFYRKKKEDTPRLQGHDVGREPFSEKHDGKRREDRNTLGKVTRRALQRAPGRYKPYSRHGPPTHQISQQLPGADVSLEGETIQK